MISKLNINKFFFHFSILGDHDASDQDDQNTEGFSVHKTQKGFVECVDIHCSMFNVLMFSVECVDAVLMLRQGAKSVECSMSKPHCRSVDHVVQC